MNSQTYQQAKLYLKLALICTLSFIQFGFPGCDEELTTLALQRTTKGDVIVSLNKVALVKNVSLFTASNLDQPVWEAYSIDNSGVVFPTVGLSTPFLIGHPSVDCIAEKDAPVDACHPKKYWNYLEINLNDQLTDQWTGAGTYTVKVTLADDSVLSESIALAPVAESFKPAWLDEQKNPKPYLTSRNIQGHFWRPSRIVEKNGKLTTYSAFNEILGDFKIRYESIANGASLSTSLDGGIVLPQQDTSIESTSSPLSKLIEKPDGTLVGAQLVSTEIFDYDLKLVVLESRNNQVNNIGTNAIADDVRWSRVGENVESFKGNTIQVPGLTYGKILGYKSNEQKPYVVSAFDAARSDHNLTNPQKIAIKYLHQNGTWQSIPTTGLNTDGIPYGGLDLAVTKSGFLYACTQSVDGHIALHEFNELSKQWQQLDSAFNNQVFYGQAHFEVCHLKTEQDTVTAVGYKTNFRLWIRQYNRNSGLTKIGFPIENLITQNPKDFQLLDSPNNKYVVKIWDVEVKNGDLYIAFGDFAGWPIWGGPPYSRFFHLAKFNGEEWVRLASGIVPRHPGIPVDDFLEEEYGYISNATNVEDVEISKDLSTLHFVGRSYGDRPDRNNFSLMGWTL